MIDLFGMGKQGEPQKTEDAPPPSPAPEPSEPAPRGSHGLWLFLLVLDSIFVIVFGGVVAAKVYEHWRTPPVVVGAGVTPHRKPAPKAPEAAKPAEPAPSTAAVAAEPPKAPEPPKPAPKPEAKAKAPAKAAAEAPRPPKPSLLTEGPKPHAAPALSGGPSISPAAVPGKAMPVVFKLHAPDARAVQLVGAFIVHGGRKDMTKGPDGVWSAKLYLNAGQYRYFFFVDRKKSLDPENPRSDRGASLLTVP